MAHLHTLQVKVGCTFVVAIHQPAPAVFNTFDRLVLLNYGRVGCGSRKPCSETPGG
jgi:hypothetical protein